jgi:parvulin-like peptidyl-prolyl isomerase
MGLTANTKRAIGARPWTGSIEIATVRFTMKLICLTVVVVMVGVSGGCGKEQAGLSTAKLALAEPKPDDITDAEAEQYYRDHPAEFTARERVRVSDIHSPDRKAADKTLKAARALARTNAAGFATLAKANSKASPYRMGNGDLGVLDAEFPLHPPEVTAAAFALANPGDVSDVVAANDGFHVLRLTERQPKRLRPFTEVRREAKARLFSQRRAQAGLRPAPAAPSTWSDAGRAQ